MINPNYNKAQPAANPRANYDFICNIYLFLIKDLNLLYITHYGNADIIRTLLIILVICVQINNYHIFATE